MNRLGERILEVLQASSDRRCTAFNVFNVLNSDGYNVTKHEFEAACKKLHDCGCIDYQPVHSSLIDIPIGSLGLLTETAELASGIDALNAISATESVALEKIRCPEEPEPQPNREDPVGDLSVAPGPFWISVFTLPNLALQVWKRVRPRAWLPGFSLRF